MRQSIQNIGGLTYFFLAITLGQLVACSVLLYFDSLISELDSVTAWLVAGIIAVACAIIFLVGAAECGRKLANRSFK